MFRWNFPQRLEYSEANIRMWKYSVIIREYQSQVVKRSRIGGFQITELLNIQCMNKVDLFSTWSFLQKEIFILLDYVNDNGEYSFSQRNRMRRDILPRLKVAFYNGTSDRKAIERFIELNTFHSSQNGQQLQTRNSNSPSNFWSVMKWSFM